MSHRWVFEDLVTLESWTMDVNPRDGGAPQYQKNVSYQATAGEDGKTLAFEGRDSPLTSEFSGVVLTETMYNTFLTWYQKRHQVQITDDLDRVFMIYITGFNPKRKWSTTHPWRHDYTCTYTVIDWA
jgi:hypothetical protein